MPLGRARALARIPPRRAKRRRGILVFMALALAVTAAQADSRTSAATVQRRVAKAWATENASGITGTMRPGGSVDLHLLLLERGGAFQRSHAERTLRAYFRKLSRIRLKDVTPRTRQTSDTYRVCTYEYAYKPQGRDAMTTLLVITLKSGRNDRWYLEMVKERRKRRSRR